VNAIGNNATADGSIVTLNLCFVYRQLGLSQIGITAKGNV
jgi:hypothetical protein